MRAITKTFPGVKALSDVSLAVRRGEIHAICGENGAGKSTLMKVLSGVYPTGSYDGEIVFEGQPVAVPRHPRQRARGIVIIHQELALVPYLSIAENIFLGNERRGRGGLIDWNSPTPRRASCWRRVGLDENPVTPIGQLGVGKQQLVEIAKALSKDVRLLILDEPTAALNDDDSAHLLDLLRRLREQGITCIMISHKLNEITAIADSMTVIRDGRTVETLALRRRRSTQERIIRGHGRPRPGARFYPDRVTPERGGRCEVEDWTVRHPHPGPQGRRRRQHFDVRAGEVVGIAGLMGAGRTELAMSVFGRSYGTRHQRPALHARQGGPGRAASPRPSTHGIAYATEDRKTYGLNLIEDIRRNISARRARQARHGFGWVNGNEEIKVAEAVPARA